MEFSTTRAAVHSIPQLQAMAAGSHGFPTMNMRSGSERASRSRTRIAGTLSTEVPQIALFRTKGLPGFNAGSRIGAELEPYVESIYPRAGAMLYRREPAMLAFNERFDILQGLDHPTDPSDPPERKQRLDWELTADIVAGNRRPIRVSAPSPEWIVAHRGTAPLPGSGGPKVGGTVKHVRQAVTIDPQWLRFEVVAASQPACGMGSPNPRRMRVLSHEPFDPEAPDASIKRWPARTQVRVNLRPRVRPSSIARDSRKRTGPRSR